MAEQTEIAVVELIPKGAVKKVKTNGRFEQPPVSVLTIIQRAGLHFNPATQKILCQTNSGYVFECLSDRHAQGGDSYILMPHL